MKSYRVVTLVLLECLLLTLCTVAYAQMPSDPAAYTPKVTLVNEKDGVRYYLVVFPPLMGRPPVQAVGDEDLKKIVTAYSADVQALIKANSGGGINPFGGGGGNPTGGGGNNPFGGGGGLADDIDSELQSILGVSVSDIMAGIEAQLKNLVTSAISDLIDASPIGEVNTLNDLLKDVYTKQQKIEYQAYKLDYEDKKAKTELGQNFINYYDQLNLTGYVQTLNQQMNWIQKLSAFRQIDHSARSQIQAAADKISNIDAITDNVRIACNKNGTMWMSTAERINILDASRDDIVERTKAATRLKGQLINYIVSANRESFKNQRYKGIFNDNTAINRYVSTKN